MQLTCRRPEKSRQTSVFCGWEQKTTNNLNTFYLGALGETNNDFHFAKANGYFSDHRLPAISVAFVIVTISIILKYFSLVSVV